MTFVYAPRRVNCSWCGVFCLCLSIIFLSLRRRFSFPRRPERLDKIRPHPLRHALIGAVPRLDLFSNPPRDPLHCRLPRIKDTQEPKALTGFDQGGTISERDDRQRKKSSEWLRKVVRGHPRGRKISDVPCQWEV